MTEIAWSDFEKVELRVGRIIDAVPFPEARNPSYRLRVDFGPLGVKSSSAQITKHYSPSDLNGRLVIGVVNFPVKRIAGFTSECLVTGFADEQGDVVLAVPEHPVPLGSKLF